MIWNAYHSFYDGGALSPASQGDIIQWLNGGVDSTDSSEANDKLSVLSLPKYTDSNCLLFDGSADYVIADRQLSFIQRNGIFRLSFWFRRDGNTAQEYVFDNEDGTSGLRVYWPNATAGLSIILRGSGGTIATGTRTMPTPENLHFYEIIGDGTDITWWQDGVQISTALAMATGNFGGTATSDLRLSQSFSSLDGILSDVKVTSPTTNNIELILMIGQSNMLGGFFAGEPDTPPAEYDIQQSDWYFSYMREEGLSGEKSARFIDLQSATFGGSPDAAWSAEIIVGKELSDNFGSKQRAMIKVARGGTNSWADWHPDGTAQEYNRLVQTIGEMVDDLENAGYHPTVTNVVLNQGEANYNTQVRAENWESDWTTIKDRLESETILTSDAKWIVARIHTNYPSSPPYADEVRSQQASFASKYGILLDTDDFSIGSDDVHYDYIGKQNFAASIIPKIEEYIEKETIHLHYPLAEGSGTTVYDVSPFGVDGTITGATYSTVDGIPPLNIINGFRDSGGILIPANDIGSLAADGNAITNTSGFTHNGSENTIQQDDVEIVDSVVVSGTGTGSDGTYLFNGLGFEGRPTYIKGSINYLLAYDTETSWALVTPDDSWVYAAGVETFPPKTGWPIGVSLEPAPTISYDSFWVENEEFANKTKADMDSHPNGSGNLWFKYTGGNVYEAAQYPLAKVFTFSEYSRNEVYFGGTPIGGIAPFS